MRCIDQAAFDERLSVVNLLLDGVLNVFYQIQREREITDAWYDFLKEYRQKLKNSLRQKDFETILAEKAASDEQNEKQQFVSKAQSDRARSLNEKLKECAEKDCRQKETINIEETF